MKGKIWIQIIMVAWICFAKGSFEVKKGSQRPRFVSRECVPLVEFELDAPCEDANVDSILVGFFDGCEFNQLSAQWITVDTNAGKCLVSVQEASFYGPNGEIGNHSIYLILACEEEARFVGCITRGCAGSEISCGTESLEYTTAFDMCDNTCITTGCQVSSNKGNILKISDGNAAKDVDFCACNCDWAYGFDLNGQEFCVHRNPCASPPTNITTALTTSPITTTIAPTESPTTTTPTNTTPPTSTTTIAPERSLSRTRGISLTGTKGIMFDLTAHVDVKLTRFIVDINGAGSTTRQITLYNKTGTFQTFEGNSGAWTNLCSAALTADSFLDCADIFVSAGETVGLYFQGYIIVDRDFPIGCVDASNDDLSTFYGLGVSVSDNHFATGYSLTYNSGGAVDIYYTVL